MENNKETKELGMNEHFYHFVPAKYNGLYLVLCTVAHSILMWVSIKQLDTKGHSSFLKEGGKG